MQDVDLVGGGLADQLLDGGRRLVVAGDVEHHAAVGVPRAVGDPHGGHRPGAGPAPPAADPGRQRLAERLDRVVEAVRGARGQPRPGRGDVDAVGLPVRIGAQAGAGAEHERDVTGLRAAADDGQRVAGGGPQVAGQVRGDRQRRTRAGRDDDPGLPGERVPAAPGGHAHRLRHDERLRGDPGGYCRGARRAGRGGMAGEVRWGCGPDGGGRGGQQARHCGDDDGGGTRPGRPRVPPAAPRSRRPHRGSRHEPEPPGDKGPYACVRSRFQEIQNPRILASYLEGVKHRRAR